MAEIDVKTLFAGLQESLMKAVDPGGTATTTETPTDEATLLKQFSELSKATEGHEDSCADCQAMSKAAVGLAKARAAKLANGSQDNDADDMNKSKGPGNTTSSDPAAGAGYASKDPDLGTRLTKMEETVGGLSSRFDEFLKAFQPDGAVTKSISQAIEGNSEPLRDALSTALDRLAVVEGQTAFSKSLTGQDGVAGAYANQAGIVAGAGKPGMFDSFVQDLVAHPATPKRFR